MIALDTKIIKKEKDVKNQLKEVKELLELLGYSGTIILDLKYKEPSDISLYKKWKIYCKKSDLIEEESYLSEWSPNNNSEVGKLMKHNELLATLINRFYDNSDRHESIDMIEIFDYVIEDFYEDYYEEDINYLNIYNNEKMCGSDGLFKVVESWEDSELKRNIIEISEVFFTRNPKFCFDW